jgi:dTDP-4-dehydrorhamnose 3,5-epimerase
MSFDFEPLDIPEVVLVRPKRHHDARGWFMETYRSSAFVEAGIDLPFVQDNLVRSTARILRGMHFQMAPAAQGKLVSVVEGRIFDVAVDLRTGAPSHGRWVGRTLDGESGRGLWVPPGFAHGYVVLSETAYVSYKVTAEYDARLDRGFRWDDPEVGIEWPISDPTLSEKDQHLPLLRDVDADAGR